MSARALFLVFAFVACSSGGENASFGSQPCATAITTSGSSRMDVFAAPNPLSRGESSLRLVVTDVASGAPIDGLTIALVPWMPAMGHGSSSTPIVTAQGGGVYLASNVVLVMPGAWELRAQMSGALADVAIADVEIQ